MNTTHNNMFQAGPISSSKVVRKDASGLPMTPKRWPARYVVKSPCPNFELGLYPNWALSVSVCTYLAKHKKQNSIVWDWEDSSYISVGQLLKKERKMELSRIPDSVWLNILGYLQHKDLMSIISIGKTTNWFVGRVAQVTVTILYYKVHCWCQMQLF